LISKLVSLDQEMHHLPFVVENLVISFSGAKLLDRVNNINERDSVKDKLTQNQKKGMCLEVAIHAMTVVSRTDLNLQNPAREGKVIYKKKDLFRELEKIFT
jgi:hypothetical protein